MIALDVDAALTEVPVNVMPLTDDTDFKTIETAVAYNASGMALYWHFVTSAGVETTTQVTPTTGGTYDWAHAGQGMYTIEIPASGGASINNDAEGYGYFTGVATGVLPWRGPTICFRAAAVNDALCDGGDLLDVSVTQLAGVAQSLTDLKDFADDGYDPSTNKVQGVVLVDTTTTNTDMISAAGIRTAVGLASANLDTQLTAIDDYIDTEVAAIKAKTDNLPSDPADASDIAAAFSTVNSTLATIASYIDTEVAAIKAKTDNLPSDPADASDIAASFTSIASTLTTIAAYIDTEVAAIKAKTDNLPSDPADQSAVEAAITAATSGLATQASVNTIDDLLDTEIAAIKADTAAILDDTGTAGVVVASGSKTGYALASTGLDSISTTAPTGVASNFREMLVQVWRRFFKKSTLTATELKTYADNGSTVLTTQPVSDDGTTQTQGTSS